MPADVRADASAAPDTAAVGAPRVTGRDLLTAGIYAALVVGLALSGISGSGFLGEGRQWSRGVSVVLAAGGVREPVLATRPPAGALRRRRAARDRGDHRRRADLRLLPAVRGAVRARHARHSARGAHLHRDLDRRRAAAMLAAALGGLPGPAVFLVAMIAGLMASTPLLWGWEVRHHREARGAAERLAGLEHDLAESRAAQAVEAERRSIAHDLHDVIAGHLSAVALHSSLAASLEDREAREGSLAASRSSAQAAPRDLRSMIGVLADEGTGTLPSATLDWPSLAARSRGAGPVGPGRDRARARRSRPGGARGAGRGAADRGGGGDQCGAARPGADPAHGGDPGGRGADRAGQRPRRCGAAGGRDGSCGPRAPGARGRRDGELGPGPGRGRVPGMAGGGGAPLDASGDPPAEPPLTGTTLTATEASPR
ncbi:histidine kinase [Brachybacterium sp. GPGPB12]|uniref:histidine kinase n=1 Tax=Brachybacterium sp. GPGPB12 TaxID=3023517 RepID=UPI0031342BE0